MDRDGGSESACWVRLLELAVDSFCNELFLITKQEGVLTDGSYTGDTKGGKLSGTSHKGSKIWGRVQRVNVKGINKEIYFTLSRSSCTSSQENSTHTGGTISKVVIMRPLG